ncbi:methionine--tRNA ligase [Ureaplasma parvum]|uniref:methionine--tRNA ligase n=1 Tax=Ureaplasma parvum TaxID=134821 RepID=UPI0026EC0C87|nr:methionine--tRNA ligase [Ureaplasma parvum]
MLKQKKFFISTPIYYSSGNPHIGHAYTTVIADVLARYKRLFGYDVFFLTGMDEHGQKIQQKAFEENISPKALVDRNSSIFLNLWKRLHISFSKFIRTTQMDHEESVQKVFSYLYKQGKIYLGQWSGYYCVSCEENYNTTEIIKSLDNTMLCRMGHKLETKSEESYFYKMSEQASFLKKYYQNHSNFIIPNERVNEMVNNFLNNLEDLSISRTTFDWGIPIAENPKHVIYVWLDALMNYLTATGHLSNNDELFQKYWCDNETEIVHLLSKEIARFHCIYWPIFLNDLQIRFPTTILSHGWIITKEGKMSKSLGNVINPNDLIDVYGADAVRYYLVADLSLFRDSVFSEANLIETYNTHLANNYGNIISRTLGMLKKYRNNIVPNYFGHILKNDKKLENLINKNIKLIEDNINKYAIDKALYYIQEILFEANKYIEDNKPWELAKNKQENELDSLLVHLVKVIQVSTILLSPILIDGTKKAIEQLNFDESFLTLNSLVSYDLFNQHKVNDSKPIFSRIIRQK